MNKCYVLFSLVILLGGCATPIRDVSNSDAACYSAIRGRTFVTARDLFLVREDDTKESYLVSPDNKSFMPYNLDDFKGQPLKFANFFGKGSVVGVVPEGALVRVAKIYEMYNLETGTYKHIYADILSSSSNRTVRIDSLLNCNRAASSSANKLYYLDKRSLREYRETN